MSKPAVESDTWSIGRLIDWTRTHFESRGVEDARLCAELLLAHAMGCPKIQLYARYHEAPTETQRTAFRDLVRAAANHEPIAYLIGEREFYSLSFAVTPDVLIPRPETELIVEYALAWIKDAGNEPCCVLDIGTGSGCIAVTIARHAPTARVVATDVSTSALAVARANAQRHDVADRVTFVEAELFGLPDGTAPTKGFDLIVSNPPYVGESERASLPANVRDYEPETALIAGADGLAVFRRVAADAAAHLRPGGALMVEIGEGQVEAVRGLFESGGLEFVAARRDLARIERMLQFTRAT